jgi:hypothetical protein
MKRTLTAAAVLAITLGMATPAIASTTTTKPKPKVVVKKKPAKKPAPKVLFQQAGSGTASSQNFTAPTNWNVTWTYDCSAFGSEGNFQVLVSQAGTGSMASLEDTPVNQLGPKGSGVQHYHYGGKLYLEMNSECTWTVVATAA